METVLPAPAVPLDATSGLTSLLKTFLSAVRKPLLSRRERAFLELFRRGTRTFGAPLLHAGDQDDLEARADDVLESEDFAAWRAELAAGVPTVDVGEEIGWDDDALAVYGLGSAQPLRTALTLTEWTAHAHKQLVAATSAEIAELDPASLAEAQLLAQKPLWFLTDRDIPLPVSRALLAGVYAEVYLLAVLEALHAEHAPAAWLARAIAERWRDNTRELLRLLASYPGVEVPENIIPAGERFDLAALEAEHAARSKAFDDAFERAGRRMAETGATWAQLFPELGPLPHD